MKNINIKKNKDSGFVLLFVVVLSSIILSIALGIADIAYKEFTFSTSAKNTNEAFFAADTGIECALYHDQSGTTSAFGQPVVVGSEPTCAGNIIDIDDSETPPLSSWTFRVLELGVSNKACAIVTVNKDSVAGTTEIISKGYNVGGDDPNCTSTDINRLERELVVRYSDTLIAPDSFTLNVTGSGTVTSGDGIINCPLVDCTNDYAENDVVTLTANSTDDINWTGCDSVSGVNGEICTVTITTNTVVNVTFTTVTYTVTPSAGPNGSMDPSTPQTVNSGSTTQFTVNPDPGYSIASVSGCSGSLVGTTYTTGTITSDCTVNATFISIGGSHLVTAEKYISTSTFGTVRSTVPNANLNCGTTCTSDSETFSDGFVTLLAEPIANWHFINWYTISATQGNASVCNTSTNPECSFTLNQDSKVYAWFGREIIVSKNIVDAGTITTDPPYAALINCGSDCQDVTYALSGSITLRAQTNSGYTFSSWSGTDCNGTTAVTCVISVNNFNSQNHNIVANYTATSPSMSGTLNSDFPSCVIAVGSSTCSVNLTWSTTNPVGTSEVTSPYPTSGTVVYTGNNGTNQPVSIPYGGRSFYLYNNAVELANITVNASSCASGSAWNGTICQTVYTLNVSKNGTGVGNVFSSVPSSPIINCGSDCSQPFFSGTAVTLNANATAPNTFIGWSGCDSVAGSQCIVNMVSIKNVIATFNALTGFPEPRLGSVNAITRNARANSHNINLSAWSGYQAGDMVLAFVSYDLDAYSAGSISWSGSGWNTVSIGPPRSNGSTINLLEVRYKIVGASEPDITINTTNNSVLNALFVPVYNQNSSYNPAGAIAFGTSFNPNSPNINSPGGTLSQNLWFSVAALDSDVAITSTEPAGYQNLTNIATSSFGLSGSRLRVVYRSLQALSEDPGPYTNNLSDNWLSSTVVVKGQ